MNKSQFIIRALFSSFLLTLILASDSFAQFETLQYRDVGPFRGGRVTSVHGVSASANIFYMGATGGGLWKTEDYGVSWKNISDGYFSTPSIGAIAVSDTDPNLLYVGTGTDGLRSNLIAGKGIYKTEDAGVTWTFSGLPKAGQIGAVEIHPKNNNVVFAAVIGQAFNKNKERGIYKTEDGGDHWIQVFTVSDTTGFVDLEFHPVNPDIVYATAWRAERKPWTIISGGKQNGIYVSKDGGDNWQKEGNGLPDLMGKIDLAVSAASPDSLWALVEARDTLAGLYVSGDQGKSFIQLSDKDELTDRPFYYCNVEVDPNDANKIYVMSTRFHRSDNGGKSWTNVSVPHGDNHDIWINPNDSNLMIQANDGGANISFNGGKTWSTQYNQNTSELYQVEVDNQYPYWLYAGQQDNYTTISVPSMAPYSHQLGSAGYVMNTGGCETGPAVPNPVDPNIVYSNCKGKFSVFNKLSGQEKKYDVEAYFMYGHSPEELPHRFQRVSPIHVSPHDPGIIYHCSQFVNKSTDEGKNWVKISPDLTAFDADKQVRSGGPITNDITGEEFYSTIYSIQESKIEKGVIYVGANDGPIHISKDGGINWINITPEMAKGGRVDSVEPSRHQKGVAYVTIMRYMLGDPKPYIYKTKDYGNNWELITEGIPQDFPVRVVREDESNKKILFAGTEYGMFVSLNEGETWESFQQNLPITPITDLKVHRGDLILSTMGRGFWILDDVSVLAQDYHNLKKHKLFKPNNGVRYRYSRSSGAGSVVPTHSYPQPGIFIDYFLKDTVSEIILDIIDESGETIRSFNNQSKTEESTERDMATNYFESVLNKSLSLNPGMHRIKWDMKSKGAWDKKESKSYSRGPLSKAGTYKITLKIDGKEYSENVQLMNDPRVTDVSKEDLDTQQKTIQEIIKLHSAVKKMAAELEEQIESDQEKDNTMLQEAYDLLVQKDGNYTKPMMIAQINYLYGIVNKADQLPGKDVMIRLKQLQGDFIDFCKTYNLSPK